MTNAIQNDTRNAVCNAVSNTRRRYVQNQNQNQKSFGWLFLLSNQVQRAFTYARRRALGIGRS